MPPFQPSTPNSLKHKPLTHFLADRLIYASFCAPYYKELAKYKSHLESISKREQVTGPNAFV